MQYENLRKRVIKHALCFVMLFMFPYCFLYWSGFNCYCQDTVAVTVVLLVGHFAFRLFQKACVLSLS